MLNVITLSVVLLSVIMLVVIMLNEFTLGIVMLNVAMMSNVMLSVMVPHNQFDIFCTKSVLRNTLRVNDNLIPIFWTKFNIFLLFTPPKFGA
jgi:hypothetical protein